MARGSRTMQSMLRLMRAASPMRATTLLKQAQAGRAALRPGIWLRAAGLGWPPAKAHIAEPPDIEVPAFETKTFSSRHGNRRYKLYVPQRAHLHPLPLLVMLHGCTQSPDDFAAGTRMNQLAETYGFLVAYPEQPASANPQKCWNWFSPADQRRGGGEPAVIAGLTLSVIRSQHADTRRVYVAGLSAGGAAAAIMGAAYPEIYAAIGVHSGLACGAASGHASALSAMRRGPAPLGPRLSTGRAVPTIVFHADADGTVHPGNGDQVLAQAIGAEQGNLVATVEQGQVPGGHAYIRRRFASAGAIPRFEQWVIHGGGHSWSGGSAAGSYTDPRGPDASRAMLEFFLTQTHPGRRRKPG